MKVVFTFGRFNPPTIGHQLLINKVKQEAGGRDYMIYASQTQNAKKDPLEFSKKVEWMKRSFPECASYISSNKSIRNVFDALVELYNKKYTEVVMMVGSDRVNEFKTLIEQYNGEEAKHGYYKFMRIRVTSAGDRDPDGEGVSGMSASKMRQLAVDGDLESFSRGVSSSLSSSDAEEMYNDVRVGMGILEEAPRRRFKRNASRRKTNPEQQAIQRVNQQMQQLTDRKKQLMQMKQRLQQRKLRGKLQKMQQLRNEAEFRIDADDAEKIKKIEKKYKKARRKWSGKVVEIGTDAAFLKHLEMLPKHYLEGEK